LPILLEGLKKLEYRGYDSAGIAFFNTGSLKVEKSKGKIVALEESLNGYDYQSKTGIGHTRWATHGGPSKTNAHPHQCCNGNLAIVHNGIIENYRELKAGLEKRGHHFCSETDTEVIVHLIEEKYKDDLISAFNEAISELEGSYAIALIDINSPDMILAARKDSPLILGIGEGENLIASDIPAVLKCTKNIRILNDGEMAIIKPNEVKIFDSLNNPVEVNAVVVKWNAEEAEKGGFEDYMLKEIYEQPKALRETAAGCLGKNFSLDKLGVSKETLNKVKRVLITACGSSYHAGLIGRFAIENWANIPVDLDFSSEFRYRKQLLDDETLVIAISQSGETADTLASIKEAKKSGAKIIAISNVVDSSISREADGTFYTHAGPEIGVAATKTYTCQLLSCMAIALYLSKLKGTLSDNEISELSREIIEIPSKLDAVLKDTDELALKIAKKYHKKNNFLFIGRGTGLPIALEGALKLKEISYIHAEGCAAGEMKHGPIALIDNKCPIVVVAAKSAVYDKIVSNIEEVKARGAHVITVATQGNTEIKNLSEDIFYIPKSSEIISTLLSIIPLQLFAYHMAKLRGCDVDQPRNLAKSVTVE
jgi:glucosamine--fructose-6-phosphate aminotransferase (isomerizing)